MKLLLRTLSKHNVALVYAYEPDEHLKNVSVHKMLTNEDS